MSKQLERLAEFEKEKEQRESRFYQQAQLNVNQHKQKLASLEQYRVDYIKGIQQTGQSGVTATYYQQHLSFVGKLDKACEQQMQVIAQAKMAADQRKQMWLKQQQKVKAVTLLLDKKRLAKEKKEAKAEQAMLDEFATQRFIRSKSSSF
ncbi:MULTISPECIES: flagellar export protein FliJ [Alteromonas]|jgi:flagellar FliJ protein|uniref:Flagellar FliJ protein n=1 Tax=Alteromonas hispanica TaxID=315421 RepID=A0A6L9MR87_9ALTE|nr:MULTISPECIES: flagellar export protein FliJ [Alteromonas]APE06010.1 flagellar export protein FliJ [Alteromonas sp. RW2A1]AUC87660.1 flagellar export protein FliJ [Alteromonas sp. MB-3u-76]MAI63887.1 flagellar export protein FliJ [Alteromonas sp.]NDW20678.1 flagellar export protein FliJ [Alteromonas hispanica]